MGQVFRAVDRTTGAAVALKIMREGMPQAEVSRFAREADVLDTARHPGIVRYVARGETADARPFFAMEWIDGETLRDRLSRRGMTIAETVTLGRRLSAALGALHRAGVVHRDLKPGNVLLRGGDPGDAVLLDLGIARRGELERLTLTGVIVGTPGFLAPEQARGEAEVDPRADVFALGCVLFMCLAGRRPFVGPDALSTVLKVVLADPGRVRDARPDVPLELDDLVARMLAKAPGGRPANGDAVADVLAGIDVTPGTATRAVAETAPRWELTDAERRVMSLVLVRAGETEEDESEATMVAGSTEAAARGAVAVAGARAAALRAVADRYVGCLDPLPDGAAVISLASGGAATDLVVRAARCAIACRAEIAGATVAIASGFREQRAAVQVGELIDRASALLVAGDRAAPVRLDELSAGLLDARFDTRADGGGLGLWGERAAPDTARLLCGAPTACVGREAEIRLVEATLARCMEDAEAGGVLVTAEAGVGKSRLRYELLRRLRARGEPVSVWLGRGEPMSAGSAFGLVARAVRNAAGIFDGELLASRREKLRARVELHVREEPARVAAFLGELCGARSPDEESVQLRAARRDPTLMGDQVRRAFEDFVRAECQAQPVILVLEDLHWGDLPTVRLVDGVLGSLADHSLMVLMLARPEVHALFPRLRANPRLNEVRLGPLPARASEKLIRAVLGDRADTSTVKLVVERAGGNAFYLEELIRAVAEDRSGSLPETVLAMTEARLSALSPQVRRVLRAASVFGQSFWEGGVSALLGGAAVGEPLADLCVEEMVSRRFDSRFPGQSEYTFRHALVCEAAYGMLIETDRALGHRLAAAFLEGAGERDPMVLGEHHERGGAPARAAAWYARASMQSWEGDDLDAALARADRAEACLGVAAERAEPVPPEQAGELRLLRAKVHRALGRNTDSQRDGREALQRLARAGPRWCDAAVTTLIATWRVGDLASVTMLAEDLIAAAGEVAGRASALDRESAVRCAISLVQGLPSLLLIHRLDLVDAILVAAETLVRDAGDDPAVLHHMLWARAFGALMRGDLGEQLRFAEDAETAARAAGDRRMAAQHRMQAAYIRLTLGDDAGAELSLREIIADAERSGRPVVRSYGKHSLGLVLARRGAIDEARAVETEATREFASYGDRRMEADCRIFSSMIALMGGDVAGAVETARAVVDDAGAFPRARAWAGAVLADARLHQSRATDALAAAKIAMDLRGSLQHRDDGDALTRVVYAEALDAVGDRGGARAAVAMARDDLLARAERITDSRLRQSFLERVPEHARTMKLAALLC